LFIKDKLLSNLNLKHINNPDIPEENEEIAIQEEGSEEIEETNEITEDEKAQS